MMRERELLKLAQERAIAVTADAENPLPRWAAGLWKGRCSQHNKMKLQSINTEADYLLKFPKAENCLCLCLRKTDTK